MSYDYKIIDIIRGSEYNFLWVKLKTKPNEKLYGDRGECWLTMPRVTLQYVNRFGRELKLVKDHCLFDTLEDAQVAAVQHKLLAQ